ncbi:hypothetical protein HDU82_003986, partial [Entophlyctis luteolus]
MSGISATEELPTRKDPPAPVEKLFAPRINAKYFEKPAGFMIYAMELNLDDGKRRYSPIVTRDLIPSSPLPSVPNEKTLSALTDFYEGLAEQQKFAQKLQAVADAANGAFSEELPDANTGTDSASGGRPKIVGAPGIAVEAAVEARREDGVRLHKIAWAAPVLAGGGMTEAEWECPGSEISVVETIWIANSTPFGQPDPTLTTEIQNPDAERFLAFAVA